MAEYENRERDYNNGLGKIVGSFAMGCVMADNMAKDAYIRRQIAMMAEDPPNVEFLARTNLIGIEQPLETRVSVPKIILAPSTPLMIENAHLSCLLYTSPSPRDRTRSRMPSSA